MLNINTFEYFGKSKSCYDCQLILHMNLSIHAFYRKCLELDGWICVLRLNLHLAQGERFLLLCFSFFLISQNQVYVFFKKIFRFFYSPGYVYSFLYFKTQSERHFYLKMR